MPHDYFSAQADAYAQHRPGYPPELFAYILGFVQHRHCAWDCATGNGQAATVLADFFDRVEATDSSEAQLRNAVPKKGVHYQQAPAEKTPFADNTFDLITVATAYHWLDWDAFYTEATRVGKPDAVVAIWAYRLLTTTDAALSAAIDHCYTNLVGPYWYPERAHVQAQYSTVRFAFAQLPGKTFDMPLRWTRKHLLGYFASWSATAAYTAQMGHSPLPQMDETLRRVWPDNEERPFTLPLFLRLGRVVK